MSKGPHNERLTETAVESQMGDSADPPDTRTLDPKMAEDVNGAIQTDRPRIVVGISGASGVIHGARVLDATMDMSAGFAAAAKIEAPQARITYDKYHVASHLNQAVDQTRRAEHKALSAAGDDTLKGQRYLFLYNPAGFSATQSQDFEELLKINLKAGRAWAYKELFTEFWQQPDRESGRKFITNWCAQVRRTRLEQMKKVAAMIQRHLEGLLNYFESHLTNALCEGFNSRIQQLKSAARGFRSFPNYRTRILFFLGALDLSICPSH